ncbi:Hypothetical protein A7982_05172 [Minicystis rosea]|nr:Hypothetical protein A7982_05172 [Minicystis rosea]
MSEAAPARVSPLARIHRQIFDEHTGAIGVAVVSFAITAFFAARLRYFHDEGLFTLDQVRIAHHELLATFFFIKAKPLLVLLYYLPAKLGLFGFLFTHAAVAALGVYFVSRAAAHLEIGHPNIAGLTLATSVTMAIAASNGVPNSDGATLLCLSLFLYFSGRRGLAAVALGALPFLRHELAPVTLLFLAWDVRERRDVRFLAAATVFPVAYWILGCLYFGSPLWLVTLFPNSQGVPEAIKTWHPPSLAAVVDNLRGALVMGSPMLAATALFGVFRRNRASILLFVTTIVIYGAMSAFQMIGVFGFDSSPRYYLAPMPLLALLAASALSSPLRFRWVPGIALALIALPTPLRIVVAVTGLFAAAGAFARSREAVSAILVAGSSALFVALAGQSGREIEQHAANHRLMAALAESGVFHGQPLFTTSYLARDDRCAGASDAYLLVNQAMEYETRSLSDRNGQIERVYRAGALEHIVSLRDHVIRRDALYAVADRPRNAAWRGLLEASNPRRTQVHDGRESYLVYSWPERGALEIGPAP